MKKQWIRLVTLLVIVSLFVFGKTLPGGEVQAADAQQSCFPNLDYMFTSVGGENVSTTTSEGQVTVIVFGKTDCGNSQATIRNIAASSWVGSKDVRVIFAECNNADEEAVKAFASTYGCKDIVFCYDTSYAGNIYNAMWEYHDLFYEPSASGSLPFTVLIDGSNQARKMLKGNQSANAIMSEIEKFSKVEYEKSYVDINIKGTENYTYAKEVFDRINQARAEKGLPALTLDQDLTKTAMQRAAEISMYYSHTRPDGSSCMTASKRGTRKSENIAAGQSSPQAVMAAWLSSSGHYANIMDVQVTSVGVGCFVDASGVCHWAQFFDNATPTEAVSLENKEAVHKIAIQKKLLSLRMNGNLQFSGKDKGKTVPISISHVNAEFAPSNPQVLASNFKFISSNLSVAEASEDGILTVKGPGTAKITVSLREEPSFLLEQTVTVLPEEGTAEIKIADVCGLRAVSGTDNVSLSWRKIKEAHGYYVYQYNSSKNKWNRIATVKTNKTVYTVKKLKAATGYRFAVKAYWNADNGQIASKSYASLYTATMPGRVQFTASSGRKKAVLKWKNLSGVSGYSIYYRTSQKASWKKLANIPVKKTKNISYTKKKLKAGKQYYFTVKAYKNYKGKHYEGASKVKKVRVK